MSKYLHHMNSQAFLPETRPDTIACRLETNFKDNNKTKVFVNFIRSGIFVAVGLMVGSGSLAGKPELAQTRSTLGKVAYIEFLCVLVALMSMCSWLYFLKRDNIKPTQLIVRIHF